jgi:hypothetical protein
MNNFYLLYIGKGKGTLIGVPARDLTFAEAEQHGINTLLASGLYVYNSHHLRQAVEPEIIEIITEEDEGLERQFIKRKRRSKKESD